MSKQKTPSVVKMEKITDSVFRFVDWVCGSCGNENVSKAMFGSKMFADPCLSCGANFNIYLDWEE